MAMEVSVYLSSYFFSKDCLAWSKSVPCSNSIFCPVLPTIEYDHAVGGRGGRKGREEGEEGGRGGRKEEWRKGEKREGEEKEEKERGKGGGSSSQRGGYRVHRLTPTPSEPGAEGPLLVVLQQLKDVELVVVVTEIGLGGREGGTEASKVCGKETK